MEWCAPKQSEHSTLFCLIESCVSKSVLTLSCLPFKFSHIPLTQVHFISVVSMETLSCSCCAELHVFVASLLHLFHRALWALLRFRSHTASIHIKRLVCRLRCLPLCRQPYWMIFQFHLFTSVKLQYWGLSVLGLSGIKRSARCWGGFGAARLGSVGQTGCLNRML